MVQGRHSGQVSRNGFNTSRISAKARSGDRPAGGSCPTSKLCGEGADRHTLASTYAPDGRQSPAIPKIAPPRCIGIAEASACVPQSP